MKDIKRKLEQLTYEIKLVKSDEPDTMTGVVIRLEELTDLVNKLLIPVVSSSVCHCDKLPDGEIAISSKALQKPYGDLGKTDC